MGDSKLLLFYGCWQALCNTLCMILVIMRMKVLSEKRLELSQTIASLIGSIRTEQGCKRCDFCQGVEDENRLFLLEEWDTEENLRSHLKSGRFRVLRGAMNLLKEPYEMRFQNVFHPAGLEGI
jgi:quinol monooxygenase YgiN